MYFIVLSLNLNNVRDWLDIYRDSDSWDDLTFLLSTGNQEEWGGGETIDVGTVMADGD